MHAALAELHAMAEPKKMADETDIGGFLAKFHLLQHEIQQAARR
jgi:hypothetical protein